MTSKTNTTTKGATTLSSSEARVAAGLAFKDATGTYSEFLLIYEEPGPTGSRTCGAAAATAEGAAGLTVASHLGMLSYFILS